MGRGLLSQHRAELPLSTGAARPQGSAPGPGGKRGRQRCCGFPQLPSVYEGVNGKAVSGQARARVRPLPGGTQPSLVRLRAGAATLAPGAPWGGGGTGMGSAPWEHSPTAHGVPVQRSCAGHGFAGRGPPGLHRGQERSQGVNGFPHPRGGRGASGSRGPAGRGMTQCSSPRPRSPHNVTREVCARRSSFPLAEGFMAAPAAQTAASSLLLLPAGETGAADVRPC